MNEITAIIDEGNTVTSYFFHSSVSAKGVISQAVSDGYLTIPSKATSSIGGREISKETYVPVSRVVSMK